MAQWFMALLGSVGLRIFSQDSAGSDSLPFSSSTSSEAYADDEDYLQPSGCYREAVRSIVPILVGGVGRSSQLSAKSSSSGSNSSIRSMAYGFCPHVTHSSSSLTVLEYETSAVRQLACQMVGDGFTLTLIGAFHRGEAGALERWFDELDVVEALDAVRSPDGDEFHFHQLPRWASSWTLALVLMSEALSATQHHLRGTPAVSGAGSATTLASDNEPDDGLQLAWFADASISRMLDFADAVATVDLKHRRLTLTEKLLVLLNLHVHVSKASEILVPSLLDESGWLAASRDMVRSLVHKIDKDFSARKERLGEVIWSVMQDAKALISSKDSWDNMPPDGEIHETTELTMEFATMLRANESVLNSIVWRFAESWHQTSTTDIIADLVSELEEQLLAESESSLDPSVRYIFLLNNCDFIEQKLALFDFPSGRVLGKDLNKLIERYFKNYMDASWEPVLSCLRGNGATTTWFQIQKQCFPLVNFQSKLEATCRAQMMWKVPNPKLRHRLRGAITKKLVGAYNDYLEAQKRGRGELLCCWSSEDMEKMLNELFEG